MEIKKQFTFSGIFKKIYEIDTKIIKISNANIFCHTNGSVLIEISHEVNHEINHKKFRESAPIYQIEQLTEEQFNDDLVWLSLDLEQCHQKIIQQPYEGDYKIEGKTIEGWGINAIIADASFKVSFKADGSQIIHEQGKYQINLRNLDIQYDVNFIDKEPIQEIVYGLANIRITGNSSAKIGNTEAEIYIKTVANATSKSDELSAEMTLKNIFHNKQESCETYATWFISLLSFSSGHCVEQIYKIKIANHKVSSEYWPGEKMSSEASGRAVIQSPHLDIFIQQCAKKVTWETFSDKGLGLALCWYINTFSSTMCEVNFLLLCTVLESLNKKYATNVSRKPILRENRDLQEKNFRNSLKKMFESYDVPYKDLFPDLEFKKVRDKIVHEGFSETHVNIALELQKLSNLVVRIFLSILDYQGDYMESVKIEIDDKSGCSHHGLICRQFPLI